MNNQDSANALAEQRRRFHASLLENNTLGINKNGVVSIADEKNKSSEQFASSIYEQILVSTRDERLRGQTNRLPGQRAGRQFEVAVTSFLENTFPLLSSLRPGSWHIENLGSSRTGLGVAGYVPYRHLEDLQKAVLASPELRTVIGNNYVISPDILIAREPEADDNIESGGIVLSGDTARYTPVRLNNQTTPILHAVISCKWTMRSDRAQNTRSEALNLIRNRKGRQPHIIAVTAEPTPSRISSLALGTGDLDCVYHFALPELQHAVNTSGNDEAASLLDSMISGERLRDIADLPLDLAI